MFTRHFYEAEEVVLALRWCVKRGRLKESLFWCLELLDSEMNLELQKELSLLWLWYFGVGRLSANPFLQSLETREDYLNYVSSLTRLPKECRNRSVLTLLVLGSIDEKQPDRPSEFPCLNPLFKEMNCSDVEKGFLRSVYQGKSRLAFDLSRPLWQSNPSRTYELIQKIQEVKHKNESLSEILTLLQLNEDEDPWPMRCLTVAAVCLNAKQLRSSLLDFQPSLTPDMKECIGEWDSMLGRRKRREFAIPTECLYGLCDRGKISNKESNIDMIRSLSYKTLEGCPFWNRVLEENAPWVDDDLLEAFYDLYFPDDIPDEWSKEDQAKSHGFCMLIGDEVVNTKKLIHRWFWDMPSSCYWTSFRDLEKYVPPGWIIWDKVYRRPWNETVSTWCMTPVKKRVLVVDT